MNANAYVVCKGNRNAVSTVKDKRYCDGLATTSEMQGLRDIDAQTGTRGCGIMVYQPVIGPTRLRE